MPAQNFTLYLVDARTASTLKPVLMRSVRKFRSLSLPGFDRALLHLVDDPPTRPRWTWMFDELVHDPSIFGQNASCGAVLLLETARGTILMSYGTGYRIVNRDAVVPDFGLRTAANLVDPESLKSLDSAALTRDGTQLREQGSGDRELARFGVDVEADLLRALTGKAADDRFGLRVSGTNSLKLRLKTRLEEIAPLLDNVLERHESDAYRSGPLAFIDYVRPVHQPRMTAVLDQRLIDALARGAFDRVRLCAPELVDWRRVAGFRFARGHRSPMRADLDVEALVKNLSRRGLTIERLKRQKIHCVDDALEEVSSHSAYGCLYAQVDRGGGSYVLFDRSWYEVDRDFAARVARFVSAIPENREVLPDYGDVSEGAYNARVAGHYGDRVELLDKQCIRVSGAASSVEPCDLLRDGTEFIHVKRGVRSSELSHLINQAVVSAELFLHDESYRRELVETTPSLGALAVPGTRPDPGNYEIVFAIVYEDRRMDRPLPFFTQLCLKRAVERLSSLGYRVSLMRVGTAEARRLTQRFQAAA